VGGVDLTLTGLNLIYVGLPFCVPVTTANPEQRDGAQQQEDHNIDAHAEWKHQPGKIHVA
jgi:hypothetical protein